MKASSNYLTREEIESWLRTNDENMLIQLWKKADAVRRENVGDEVHFRGLVEISNHCARRCSYCGLNVSNAKIPRYGMSESEILECACKAREFGYGTVVMQSGEDHGIRRDWMAGVIKQIKDITGLAVTLSLGERCDEDLVVWKRAGADRYLLRFETSNKKLFEKIHPPLSDQPFDRIAMLGRLRSIGYEVGSGVMIGIPGQSYGSLANDIDTFRSLDLDMIGVGPYIPHPETDLIKDCPVTPMKEFDQVPNTELMTYKVIALTRLACPWANIPSTTALATINKKNGRELGLMRGANIVMPNLTPQKYRAQYEIYPDKACVDESADQCGKCLAFRISSIGRKPGQGTGSAKGRYHQPPKRV